MNTYKYVPDRSILLSGEVSHETLGTVLPMVARMDLEEHPEGIHLLITSPGGLATVGMALYDLLKTCRNPVTVVGSGECSSVAVLLLQAGTRRLLTPHTRMLIHYGSADLNGRGQVDGKSMLTAGHELSRLDRIYLDVLCERLRDPADRKVVNEMLRHETYLTAQQAVDIGLADALTYTPTYLPKE